MKNSNIEDTFSFNKKALKSFIKKKSKLIHKLSQDEKDEIAICKELLNLSKGRPNTTSIRLYD